MSKRDSREGRVTILIGDVRARLRELPADYFDCVVTSPPYWGLRDYGVAGQIGLEATLGEHLAVMVDLFREVRRVLKPSGTLWLNYGDCYATTPNGRSAADAKASGGDDRTFRDKPASTVGPIYVSDYAKSPRHGGAGNKSNTAGDHGGRIIAGGVLKPKDLCMIPNRLAIALQDDGWWVRSEIVWGKPNAMPDSSGRYRPATAHEKWFLLTKSDHVEFWVARDTGEISSEPDLTERVAMVTTGKPGPRWIGLGHYYNAAAVRIDRAGDEDAKGFRGGSYVNGVPGPRQAAGNKRVVAGDRGRSTYGRHTLGDAVPDDTRRDKQRGHSRRHAGFNERWDGMEKAEQCANGRLLRNYEPAPLPVWEVATAAFRDAHFATFPPELVERCLRAGCPPGGRVLDPFGGAGTTGLVADTFGIDCTLIELNPAYAEIARKRLALLRASPLDAKRMRAAAREAQFRPGIFGDSA
ncbi:Methyltransferase [Hyphomicrobiales bacterium]|nr:Methyltransferase [Hyphomicrobiales bacterium]CAH1667794.1 Methyltransferase [Hyphomicrobiales bacterium]